MAQTILYYPTIDIQDSTWLRNALLYWDNISSIVPYEDYCDFSPELLFLQECGIYKPVFPQDVFSSEYSSTFAETIIVQLERYKKRCEKLGGKGFVRPLTRIHKKKVYAPVLHELIHYAKVPPDLSEYLLDKHFINDYNCGGWMEIEAGVASIYMRTLAEYVVKCHSDDIVMGTDQKKYQADFYTRVKPQNSSACVSLELNNCLPQPSMDVSFEELLDFKSRHRREFTEFRKKLREFERTISECNETEELKFETEKFKESWQSALLEEKSLFTDKLIPFTLGTLHTLISVPTIVESIDNTLQSVLPKLNSPIVHSVLLGGTGAISLGYKFVNYRKKVNEKRSSSGFSYVIKASHAGIINKF